jgi:hypothetical protein
MPERPIAPKGLYSHALKEELTMQQSDQSMQQASPSGFLQSQDYVGRGHASYRSHGNGSASPFTDVHREAFFWRHKLAAVLDAAESDLCRRLAADKQDPEIQAEIAVALDTFLDVRNSAAGWQDMHSTDSELIRRAFALLRNVPGVLLTDSRGSQPKRDQRPFFFLCRR